MKTLVLLLTVLATASAMESLFWMGDYADDKGELGKGCCLPTQWEGRVGAFHISKKFLIPKFRASDSKVGLDYPGKKVAARTMSYCKKTKRVYHTRTVADFNAKKAYFIYKDKCKTFKLRRSMRRPCIPDFFRQYSPYFYGAGQNSLPVTAYGYRNASRALTTEVFSVVTSRSCVPIKGAYRVKRRFRSMMGNYQYYNVTSGIKDRELYNVPDFCKNNSSTAEETSGSRRLWRKFKNYVGLEAKEMKSDVEVASLVEDDFLAQMMDLIDGSMEQAMGGAESGHDHWRRSGRHRSRRHRGGGRGRRHRGGGHGRRHRDSERYDEVEA
uniref:Protein virilizer n=1 Tax=Macrostomum lignano TaxID=282301 RepID=A0A1I8G057_9PLAT